MSCPHAKQSARSFVIFQLSFQAIENSIDALVDRYTLGLTMLGLETEVEVNDASNTLELHTLGVGNGQRPSVVSSMSVLAHAFPHDLAHVRGDSNVLYVVVLIHDLPPAVFSPRLHPEAFLTRALIRSNNHGAGVATHVHPPSRGPSLPPWTAVHERSSLSLWIEPTLSSGRTRPFFQSKGLESLSNLSVERRAEGSRGVFEPVLAAQAFTCSCDGDGGAFARRFCVLEDEEGNVEEGRDRSSPMADPGSEVGGTWAWYEGKGS